VSAALAETQSWVPDWTGKTVAIIASGPSTKKEDVARLKGLMPVIAIKENYDLAPWADVVYGCDAPWWVNRQGLKDYKGIKVTGTGRGIHGVYPDIHIVTVRPPEDRMLLHPLLTIGAGGNSGFQAVNLAVQFGAKRLLLLGFDMSDRSGVHWYGRNSGMGRNNPCETNFRRWRAAFEGAKQTLTEAGVEVINAAPHSALKAFPRMTVEQALGAWGLDA
jgi:hypothetical protein